MDAGVSISNKENSGRLTVVIDTDGIVVTTVEYGNTSTSVRISAIEWVAVTQAARAFCNILHLDPRYDYDD